jgi:hypothetical protein
MAENDPTRGESEQDRLARNMGELLQELRVAQTGVQILFAFLLSAVFAARFADATTFERTVAITTVMLTTVAAALLMAPAAWHRLYFRQGRRYDILRWANRFAIVGLAVLAAAMTGAVLLVADAVVGDVPAIVLAGCAGILLASVWFVLPLTRRRHTDDDSHPSTGGTNDRA